MKPLQQHTDRPHARLGASSAHRWMNCPGSIRLAETLPDKDEDKSSWYARQGTAAHELVEKCLTNGLDPETYIGSKFEGVKVDADMAAAVRVYVDWIRGLEERTGAKAQVEVQFSLEELNPPEAMFGTADAPLYDVKGMHLYVPDYKHGQGVVVEAKDNPQLLFYALGAVLAMKVVPKLITPVIIQPRASHPDGMVRMDTITWRELVAFKERLMEAAWATQDPDAPLVAGSWCRWCPASAICPAQKEQAVALVQQEFEAMEVTEETSSLPAPETLADEELAVVLEKGPLVVDWINAVKAFVQQRLESGGSLEGTKLVAKRANRKWKDEEATLEYLATVDGLDREQFFTDPKLKSPRQVELLLKTVGAELPFRLASREPSGHHVVPADDPRPAVLVKSVADEFADTEH